MIQKFYQPKGHGLWLVFGKIIIFLDLIKDRADHSRKTRQNYFVMGETVETCQNCERSIGNLEIPMILKESIVCPECYARLGETASVASFEPQNDADKCPSCGSTDLQRAEVIFNSGTSVSLGGAILGGEDAIFASTSRTGLARQWSPPSRPRAAFMMLASTGSGIVAALFFIAYFSTLAPHNVGEGTNGPTYLLGGFLVGTVCVVTILLIPNARKRETRGDLAYSKWKKTWVCLRCGDGFLQQD